MWCTIDEMTDVLQNVVRAKSSEALIEYYISLTSLEADYAVRRWASREAIFLGS